MNAWVPNDIKERIAALLPPIHTNSKDLQVCKENAVGCFSIAEMYYALCDFDTNETCSDWRQIWRLKVPERVRAFIWLVKHGRLLTNERKHRMGLGTDQCDYCRDSTDTVLHALRDCPLIHPLWIIVVDISLSYQFFSCNLQEWISLNVTNRSGNRGHDDWSCFWAMGCHLAWTWRNKERYDEDFIRPIKQTEVVRQRMDSYRVADRVMQADCQQPRSTVDIGWKPPNAG
jgi:hypothetical protein